MKYAVLFILSLSFAVSCSTGAVSLQQNEYAVKQGQRLDVSLETGGSLDIQGWDRNIVSVEVDYGRDDPEDYKVDIHETRSGIAITTSCRGFWREHRGSLRLKVMVPSRFDVEMESKGGDMSITEVEGIFEGKTMGGDLELSGLRGEVDLVTMGGDIDLRDSHLEGRVHTMGGDVSLDDVTGSVKSTTMGGDITYENRGDETTDKPIRISTMGGDIDLIAAPAGAEIKTMGGDINIRSAGQYVKARTMGGDIEIEAIDGRVKATTMGGDVEVTMVGDPAVGERDVELVSKGGDVTLTVPEGLSMDIDITLAYTRRDAGRYEIISDFDLELKESEDWKYRLGSARKYIYGTGKTGDGKNSIRIETVNGKIILRKG